MLPLVLAVSCALLAPHPNSASRSELIVRPGRIELALRCQVESVNEVVPADADGNGLLEPHELDAVADELSRYLLAHYVLRADGPDSAPLPGRVHELALVTDDRDALLFAQFVDARIVFDAPPSFDALLVEMTLYFETSPRHNDACRVRWPGGAFEDATLWAGRPTWTFHGAAPVEPPSWLAGLRAGALRMFGGWAHVGLLLCIVCAAERLRTGLRAVLFVALAHAVALLVVRAPPAWLPVDWALAAPVRLDVCAGVLVAAAGSLNVLRRGPRPVVVDAVLGGLVLGARDALGDGWQLALPSHGGAALTTYVVGLDLAWLVGFGAAVLVLRPLPRRVPSDGTRDRSLVPAAARDVLSMTCAIGGTYFAASALLG